MDITPLIPQGKKIITGYGAGGFEVNGEALRGSLLILPDRVQPWQPGTAAEITLPSLPIGADNEEKIELLLIGTGAAAAVLPADIRPALRARGIALEVMNTGAACRTYNVLLGEGRPVAAALVAV